jgi:hypothetical protein
MKVDISSNQFDLQTRKIMFELQSCLSKLSNYLSQDFGSKIENLWIDLELSSIHAQFNKPYSLRFQKKVSNKSKHFIGLHATNSHNVAHYSVQPDFNKLVIVDEPIKYLLEVIYNSTETLIENIDKFPNFNVQKFREEYLIGCKHLGFILQ